MGIFASALKLKHMATTPTPPAGESILYPKADGQWYSKTSAGIEAPVIGRSEDTGWINMTLLNGWANWGGGWAVGRYRRLNGVVYVEGFLNAAGRTSGTIAVLPEGFRPKEHTSNTVPGINQTNAHTAISIESNGNVVIQGGYSNNNSSWVSLGNISYAVDQPTSFVVGDDTGWITPTFQNSWVDYGGIHAAAYRRVNGIVYLKGLIRYGTVGSVPAFTLPVGFRPKGYTIHNTRTATGTVTSAYVQTRDTGWVEVIQAGSNDWVSLDGISFPAESPPVAFTPTVRRGGHWRSATDVMPHGSATAVFDQIISGENLISGGKIVIPSEAGGIWSFTAIWISGSANHANKRAFLQIDSNVTPAQYSRSPMPIGEDQVSTSLTTALTGGAIVNVALYYDTPPAGTNKRVDFFGYRVGN